MKAALCALALCGAAFAANGATPLLLVPDFQLGQPGGRVPPNLLLDLSLTFADAGAAYRAGYDHAADYAGYFNPRMCYRYPMIRKSASVQEPDLDQRSGHFSISGAADARHECDGASFSGNFLNWASASTLDLLRYGLTGGDRVIDEPGLTVLQRAWLPDGRFHPDFYASDVYFPRKAVAEGGAGSAPDKVTPFAADTLYVVSCRNRILFSHTKKGSSCDAPRYGASGKRIASDKFFGEFNARVAVCSGADAASRPELCRRYEGGFKPEGSVQQYAAQLRVGVMSYLTEHGADDPNLYGGVLRAPLKFIGATAFDAPGFGPSANARPEWDSRSGVLAPNPDAASVPASGTINYINQLGRSQPARPGAYKTADPGAELFYESLRYLQARDPSPAAIAPVDDAGFPAWTRRADPVTAACQRNVVATVGHPAFAQDRYVPGNTRADHADSARAADPFAPSSSFDVMQASRRVGAMEADSGGSYGNRAPRPDLLALDAIDDGPGGAGSRYLAGAAFWAHTNAIRPDKPVRIDSYALEIGTAPVAGSSALYLAAKYGAFDDRNGDANPFSTSTSSGASEWSADGSTPAAFFSGADPHQLIPSVGALFAAAAGRHGLVPGAAILASRGGASFVVDASHEQSGWTGSLRRRSIAAGAGGVEIGSAPDWDAAAILNGDAGKTPPQPPTPAPSARSIYTLVHKPDQSSATVPFSWNTLPAEQRGYLDLAPSDGSRDGLGEARTAFLRGERAHEIGQPGGVFRHRAGVLGDSVHSAPVMVGAPSAALQGASYAAFYARYKNRRSAIYLGANDGMLHAFDGADGSELFAYVPNALVPSLNQLSSPAYQHRAFVDGSPGYGEAFVNGSWKTVLVSGMGMGARGVFALDISDPSAFPAGGGALWEFTEHDDPAIGHVSAPPQVAKLQTGLDKGLPVYRYFAVLASGINNYGPDVARTDAGGALFLLALDKPATARWRLGVNYYRLATPVSEPGKANALAAPALVTGADGGVRMAYAGDLQGNLWRFDFSGKPPWASATGAGEPKPLFVARDASGQRQPIAHAPRVVFAPGGGYVVLFGTGRMLEQADLDPANFAAQSFYAVHDSAATPPVPVRGRDELAPRTLAGTDRYAITGAAFELAGQGAKKGWYFDFPQAASDGERLASSPMLSATAVVIDSAIPGAGPCGAGASRSYVLDTLSGFAFNAAGLAASTAETGTLAQGVPPGPPLLFELSAITGASNATGGARATRALALVRLRGDSMAPVVQPVSVMLPARRVSWREVANWPELHDAAAKK